MGAQFESFTITFLLLIALPPSFSGAFLFLDIFGKSLNSNSIIVLIVLFGKSVNNSILLYESCISKKTITTDAIINSCKEKLRAIIITNITTICALLPFAIDPFNKSSESSLAITIIGGLIFSVILVLLVVPVLFSLSIKKKSYNEK